MKFLCLICAETVMEWMSEDDRTLQVLGMA
jgi:hypothetical protein